MNNPEEKQYKYCPQCKTDLVYKMIDGRNRLHCSQCHFIYWNNPKPVVSIIIHTQNEILMVQRAEEPQKGYWVLPGGYLEYEEKPIDGILRELKEETGLDATIEKLIGVYQITTDPRGIHIDMIYAGTSEDTVALNAEMSKYRFFSKKNLPEQIAYNHREAIEDYFHGVCKKTSERLIQSYI